jgi:hypothetical protein
LLLSANLLFISWLFHSDHRGIFVLVLLHDLFAPSFVLCQVFVGTVHALLLHPHLYLL